MKKFLAASVFGAVAFATDLNRKFELQQSNARTCEDWGIIELKDNLYFLNNKWGVDTATGDSY
jgi:hypothetical protein